MKSQLIKTRWLPVVFMLLCVPMLSAQELVRYDSVPGASRVQVDGTSTLHDWTVKGPIITGHLTLEVEVANGATMQAIRQAMIADPRAAVEVEIPVASLKSGKKDMDKKMYDAMRLPKHAYVRYRLSDLTLPTDVDASQDEFAVQTTGELTVAGVTRELRMPMTLHVIDAHHLKVTGRTSMKMTDFKIKPPEAMFGMIKSGNAIVVTFEWFIACRSVQEP